MPGQFPVEFVLDQSYVMLFKHPGSGSGADGFPSAVTGRPIGWF
jgi:hypothetical protein